MVKWRALSLTRTHTHTHACHNTEGASWGGRVCVWVRLGPGACWRVASSALYWFAACVFDSRISSLSTPIIICSDSIGHQKQGYVYMQPLAPPTCVIIIARFCSLQVGCLCLRWRHFVAPWALSGIALCVSAAQNSSSKGCDYWW